MQIPRKVGLCFALIFLHFNVSCTGNMHHSMPSGMPSQNSSESSEGLVNWESTPQVVGQGNGLQLMLETSESMKFIYAAYQEKGGQDLLYLSSHNVGDTFSKPYPVNQVPGEVSAHGENGPLLRKGTGIGVFAVWQGGKDIKFARSMNFGRSFSPAIKVNDEEGEGYRSFQAMEVGPDGTIYVAWLDGRDKKNNPPGTGSLYIAKSVDQGGSFGKNIKVSGAICPCCRPAIAFDDKGTVFISWRHVYEGDNRIVVVSRSQDQGETWSEKVRVTQEGWKINGCAHSGPAMGFADGTLFVTWFTGVDNRSSLRGALSADGGNSFQFLGDIHGEVLDANHPAIQMVGKEAWVIFQGRERDRDDGWAKIRPWIMKISATGRWSQPEKVPFLGKSASYPSLFAGTGGRIYATWTERAEDGQKAILCRGRLSNKS